MIYSNYLICLLLMIPAFGLAAMVMLMQVLSTGSRGWSSFFHFLAFFGSGVAEPLRYGWRVLALLAVIGLFLSAGAIPSIRILSFYGLSLLGTLCIAFTLFAATQEGTAETLTALLVLTPSLVGIVTCLWFAAKFRT